MFKAEWGDNLPLLLVTKAPKYYKHRWISTYALEHLRKERQNIRAGKCSMSLDELVQIMHRFEHNIIKKINNAVKNLDK